MKFFSKDNPARPLYLTCLVFFLVGQALYLAAYFMPTPHWGRELMTWATPTVQGLNTAARVAVERQTDPFPAQVVILYCAVGMVVLIGGWGLFCICGNRDFLEYRLQEFRKNHGDGQKARLKAFFTGLGGVSIFPFLLYFMIFCSVTNITWRTHNLFSSSIGSISFLLLATASMSLVTSTSPLFLLFAFKPHAISSNKGE